MTQLEWNGSNHRKHKNGGKFFEQKELRNANLFKWHNCKANINRNSERRSRCEKVFPSPLLLLVSISLNASHADKKVSTCTMPMRTDAISLQTIPLQRVLSQANCACPTWLKVEQVGLSQSMRGIFLLLLIKSWPRFAYESMTFNESILLSSKLQSRDDEEKPRRSVRSRRNPTSWAYQLFEFASIVKIVKFVENLAADAFLSSPTSILVQQVIEAFEGFTNNNFAF